MQVVVRKPGKRRLLYVIDDMGTGGAQKQLAETIRRLDDERFTAAVVCLSEGGRMLEGLPPAVSVEILGAPKIFDRAAAAAVMRLARVVRAGRHEIVEAYLPAAHLLCALVTALRRKPLLVAARRNLSWLDPAWFAALAPVVEKATALSIANSRAVKRSVVERYGVRPSRIAVIGNAVRVGGSIEKGEARRHLGLDSEHFVVAAAGMMVPVKDYPTLVTAFAHLAQVYPKATLVVAGDGPLRDHLGRLAGRLGLNGQVRFQGVLDDTGLLLAAADAFVHASTSEGSSNAVLEAAAFALPIVASDIESTREALGEDGARYFAPRDWRGCRDALFDLTADADARHRLGLLAAERVRSRFAPETIAEKRQQLYRRILEKVDEHNGSRLA